MLQETQNMDMTKDNPGQWHTYKSTNGKAMVLVAAKHTTHHIRHEAMNLCVAVCLRDLLAISIYLPDSWNKPHVNREALLELFCSMLRDVGALIKRTWAMGLGQNVLVGMDGQIELDKGMEGVTGSGCRGGTPKYDGWRDALATWAQDYGIKAANTYGEWQPTRKPCIREEAKQRNELGKWKVMKYVFIPKALQADCKVLRELPAQNKTDHYPIICEINLPDEMNRGHTLRGNSLRGWQPKTENDARTYRRRVEEVTYENMDVTGDIDLEQLGKDMVNTAETV